MVKLSCFGASVDDDIDITSRHSLDSDSHRPATHDRTRNRHHLFPNKRVMGRKDVKQRLKKILNNVKKDKKDPNDKHDKGAADDDPEFIVLGKIYSELDATVDLNSIARNRFTIIHLLPFLMNTLLYGFNDQLHSISGANSRSTKKSSLLRVTRDPNQITLGGTSHLVKAQCEKQLESFLYQQAMHSVTFALECMWYLTGSLYLGPKQTYHRTMTLLLGLESVVTNSEPPGDLFKKAHVTETLSPSPLSKQTNNHAQRQPPPRQVKSVVIPYDRHTEDLIQKHPTATGVRVDLDISGNGLNDHHMQFQDLKVTDAAKLTQWLDARRERANTFHAQLDFVKCLTHISSGLVDIERDLRRDVLRRELEKLNDYIPTNVSIPTERRPHRVLRIVPEDAHVFSTRERAPFLLVVEVEDLAPEPLQPRLSDEHAKTGPLRRIGSISAGASPKPPQSPHQDQDTADTPISNQPGSRFEFSPDVTAEGNSGLVKRESSFRVEPMFADDRRPPDEELLKALGERWAVKSERLRKASPFGDRPNWRLVSCIVKARDQLRQEMFAQRLIQEFCRIFKGAGIPVWLRPYEIISTSSDSGLIETLTDAKSIDSIKKNSQLVVTLQDYFVGVFGGRGSQAYKRAVRCFVQSMAGYSVVQFILNLKDRHNGNLMIDAEGHIIHIDFGFLLSNSPGGNLEFEKAPFKLTTEMVQVMGGSKSSAWKLYRKLCVQAYLEVSRYANKIMLMVDTMYPGNESMPCFLQGREYVLENLRDRFGLDLSKKERAQKMLKLIDTAHGNWTTRAYDQYQRVSNSIAK